MEENIFALIKELYDDLGLGEVGEDIGELKGGLLHKMYYVKTTSAEFAVKALNPAIMRRPMALKNTIFSEKVAKIAEENGINLIRAKWFNGNVIQEIQGRYFMIFDFLEGKALKQEEINIFHSSLIGEILGKLHSVDFSSLLLDENENISDFENQIQIDWNFYAKEAKKAKSPWIDSLEESLDDLYSWTEKLAEHEKEFCENLVISHRDMDSKNVLWKGNTPFLIDWESAGFINPYCDLLETALYWSSEKYGNIDKDKFVNMIKLYSKIKPLEKVNWNSLLNKGYSGVHWLEYSLKRALSIDCNDESEQALGVNQFFSTIKKIKEFDNQRGKLLEAIENF